MRKLCANYVQSFRTVCGSWPLCERRRCVGRECVGSPLFGRGGKARDGTRRCGLRVLRRVWWRGNACARFGVGNGFFLSRCRGRPGGAFWLNLALERKVLRRRGELWKG